MQVEVQAKKWGNSMGVILPHDLVKSEHIKEKDKLVLEVKKQHKAKEFFGLLKGWKRSTQEIKDEMRSGW